MDFIKALYVEFKSFLRISSSILLFIEIKFSISLFAFTNIPLFPVNINPAGTQE
jgi:hypothetical protein